MRITREADYALRIIYTLMKQTDTVSAREISEASGLTPRFTLKILNKLGCEGIVSAKKGAAGGYQLSMQPSELSLGQIIECIDGPFELAHCLNSQYDCSRVEDKRICQFHRIFNDLNAKLKKELYDIKMSDIK